MPPAPQPLRIACIGEAMIELSDLDRPDGRVQLDVAGDVLNAAIYLARALPPAAGRVAFVSVVGRDRLSARMLARITAEGIETDLVGRHPERLPGLYAIETEAGERRFRYWRERSAARTLFDPDHAGRGSDPPRRPPAPDDLLAADVLWLSGITLAIVSPAARRALVAAATACRARGGHVIFDSNYRPALWPDARTARAAMAAMWPAVTLALPSADDEALLWGEGGSGGEGAEEDATIARIAAAGVPEIALKRGAAGPRVWRGGEVRAGPFPAAARVVDTTAAGDSFGAGYAAARLSGAGPAEAARAGHALACRVVAHAGAIVPRDAD